MRHRSGDFRIGFGTDIHRLRPGEGFPLGGVVIACGFGVVAVSDGDVLFHALVDAILGACGLGDIGEHFPESMVLPGQESRIFVEAAVAKARENGWEVVNVDTVLDVEVVKLRTWRARIRNGVAHALQTGPERVNVKAKTAEGLGPIGEGRAVAAQVVVLLGRRTDMVVDRADGACLQAEQPNGLQIEGSHR